MSQKRVYTFGNGKAEGNAQMREELGGKGANLAEMNLIGVPVPPGFTITTDCCNEYYEVGQEKIMELLNDDVMAAVKHIEALMNSKFGDTKIINKNKHYESISHQLRKFFPQVPTH